MAHKVECDRCGKIEESNKTDIRLITITWQNANNSKAIDDILYLKKDLCKKCTMKVINLVKEKL